MALILCVLLLCLLTTVHAAPEVQLGKTTLVGQDLAGLRLDFFGGIPFAEPPVGALRFRSPILKTILNSTTFDASKFGKSCLQPPFSAVPLTDISEDCLTLNIHRPSGVKQGSKLPVLVWAYGGGFVGGSSSQNNGSGLVSHSVQRGTPIIYVNFNYRLGPFGFPQGREAQDRNELNLALKDQLTALKWVQANIDLFGGDKTKVTVFGESAGSIMTSILYLNSNFETLARGAILESGSANTAPAFNATRHETAWQTFVGNVPSCASFATSGNTFPCLQNATQAEILEAYLSFFSVSVLPWAPVLDSGPDSLYPDLASRLYSQGHFARIPFIAGTNLDEGTGFVKDTELPNLTEPLLKLALILIYSPPLVTNGTLRAAVDRLVELYPDVPSLGSPYNTGDELFGLPSMYKRAAAIQGDIGFDAPRRMWMQSAAAFGVKAYGYHFTQPQLGDPALGVPHGSEIPFVYGSVTSPTPSARRLSTIIMDYWISFTVSLDPNDKYGAARPTWPSYTSANQTLIQLNGDNTTTIKDDYRKERLDFLVSNALTFRQ